jgi:dephospho-CoA kinase
MIIGITGTIGAGKGTVVDYLVEQKGFAHYSVRDFLVEEIQKRGMPVNRDSMREVANSIRAEYKPSHIIETLFNRAQEAGHDALIESVRALGEAQFLKEAGVKILAVDADRKLRFERVKARGSATDDIDFDTFVQHEEREFASTDPTDMNMIGVMQMADARIENDSSLEELYVQVEQVLAVFP